MDLVKAVQSLTTKVKGGRMKAPVPDFHGSMVVFNEKYVHS